MDFIRPQIWTPGSSNWDENEFVSDLCDVAPKMRAIFHGTVRDAKTNAIVAEAKAPNVILDSAIELIILGYQPKRDFSQITVGVNPSFPAVSSDSGVKEPVGSASGGIPVDIFYPNGDYGWSYKAYWGPNDAIGTLAEVGLQCNDNIKYPNRYLNRANFLAADGVTQVFLKKDTGHVLEITVEVRFVFQRTT